MSKPWKSTTIRQCLVESFAGEWGSDPKPGNAKVLRATDIDDDGHVVGPGAIRQLSIGKLTAKRLLDGDILLEGSGGGPGKPVGRVAYFEADDHYEAAVCSNFFKTLRPNRGEVEPRFLLRKLAWFYKQPALLTLQQQTTGIINLKFEEYLSAQIEIPKIIGEQQKIAAILDTLDTAIHETEAIIAKLKAVKQGLLHDLLTRGIAANGELRPPQTEAPHLYKLSPLGWIPKEWDTSTVANSFCVDSGITLGPHRLPRSNAHPYLRVANVYRARLHLDDVAQLQASAAEMKSKALRVGDLLLVEGHASVGEIGRCALVTEAAEGMLFQNHLFRLRAISVAPNFGLLWLNSAFVRNYWRNEAATSSGLNTINRTKLSRLGVALPTQSEQEAIATCADTANAKLAAEEYALTKWQQQKSALMDDLLTGRVRVTPLLEAAAP